MIRKTVAALALLLLTACAALRKRQSKLGDWLQQALPPASPA